MPIQIMRLFYSFLLYLTFSLILPSNGYGRDADFIKRWWADNSFWNISIESEDGPNASYTIAPYSDAAIQAYRDINKPINMNWDSAGVAVVYGDSRTDPTASVTFKNYPDWFWTFPEMPMPQDLIDAINYSYNAGNSDRMTCLYDAGKKGFYSFWKGRINPDGKTISFVTGAFNPVNGAGGSFVNQFTPTGGRVAGANYCGGLIRPEEIENGVIHHALAMVWPNNLNRSYAVSKGSGIPAFTYPANHTDGTSKTLDGTIPMGARLQLDPDFDLSKLSDYGLNKPGDRVIAKALQEYGAFVMDSNTHNANAGLYFQSGHGRGRHMYDVTNPWPAEIINKMRFIETNFEDLDMAPLDTAESVGLPLRRN